MDKRHYFLFLIIAIVCFFSCDDIVEEDISDDKVVLLAPGDGVTVNSGAQLFWWEELEGASSYQLQVVTPSFDSIIGLVADQEVTDGLQVEVTLGVGDYQWRVIGKNFGYETEENTIFDLRVENDSLNSLVSRTIILTAPNVDACLNAATTEFAWQALSNADSYQFQVAAPDFTNNANIIINEPLNGTTYLADLEEREYSWRVRGENDTSVTPYTERQLTIDRTPPLAPVLESPPQGATVTMPVTLSWSPTQDAVADTLYVYKDSLVTAPVLKLGTTGTSHLFDSSVSNVFFWRLQSVDKAGNVGSFSELRKFETQ